jgi:hypothetical protein
VSDRSVKSCGPSGSQDLAFKEPRSCLGYASRQVWTQVRGELPASISGFYVHAREREYQTAEGCEYRRRPQDLSPIVSARRATRLEIAVSRAFALQCSPLDRRSPPLKGGALCDQPRQQKPALCGGFKPSPGLEPGTASLPWRFCLKSAGRRRCAYRLRLARTYAIRPLVAPSPRRSLSHPAEPRTCPQDLSPNRLGNAGHSGGTSWSVRTGVRPRGCRGGSQRREWAARGRRSARCEEARSIGRLVPATGWLHARGFATSRDRRRSK